MNKTATTLIAAVMTLAFGLVGLSIAQADDHKKGEAKEAAPAKADADGWIVLFDGKSTDALRGYKKKGFPDKGWKVEDGTLRVIGKTRGSGDIITKQKFSEFDLRWQWKVAPGANSGVMYRVEETKGPSYMTGPEYQILGDKKHRDGKNAKTSAGALYALIACNSKKKLKPVGEWNSSRIVIKGNKVQHWLNGEVVVEYVWGGKEIQGLIAKSKFRKWKEFMTKDAGHIAFQYHNDDVWYRDIKIKDLSTK